MIEIFFSDSACGSFKMAQRFGDGEYLGGTAGGVGIIVSHSDGRKATRREIKAAQLDAEQKFREAWKNAVPLGGDPADIFGLNLLLSVGDITEKLPGPKRQQELEHLFSVYPDQKMRHTARDIMNRFADDWRVIQERAAAGESLRIWYSNQPDDMCGLYWLMEQLQQWDAQNGEIILVKLSEWESLEKNSIEKKIGWGNVTPEEFRRYLDLQISAPPAFLVECSLHWRQLQKENARLRAVLNGQLVSVPETIYDHFILREIEAENEEFLEAMVIGRVLGKYDLGIGDAWLALRIEEMIRAGNLEVVSPVTKGMPNYHRMLRKHS